MWPPSVQTHLKYLFMYKKITDENTKNSEKSIIKKAIVQKLWVIEKKMMAYLESAWKVTLETR